MKNLLIGFLIILAFIGGYFFSQKYNFKVESKNPPVVSPTISPTVSPTIKQEILVGNDADEHGCKGSAGYSWCEQKQKCLRVFEEKCEASSQEDIKTIIKNLLVEIHGQSANDLTITVSKQEGDYAKGGASAQDGGGMWLATKHDGRWTIVWEGNGVPDCQHIKSFNFPADMLTNVCN